MEKMTLKMSSKEKPEKKEENLSVSLFPKVGHWQSAPSFCRILSPLYSLSRASVVVESKSPSSSPSELI